MGQSRCTKPVFEADGVLMQLRAYKMNKFFAGMQMIEKDTREG